MTRRTEQEWWTIARKHLTERELEAALYVWRHGVSQRTAAAMLGISRGTLQDRLRSARKKLHDHKEAA